MLASPILDTLTITIGVLVLIRARGAAKLAVGLLILGIVLMAISNDVFFNLVGNRGYNKGDLLDVGWATALVAQFEQYLRAWLGHKRSGVLERSP